MTYALVNEVNTSNATVTFRVFDAPVAVDDAVSAAADIPRVLDVPGLLANDVVNGATLASYGIAGTEQTTLGSPSPTTSGGSVTVNPDGSFTYTPAAGFTGADSFRYVLSNVAGSVTGTVAITVLAAPQATADAHNVLADTTLDVALPGVLQNDVVNSASITSFGATGTEQTALGSATLTTAGGSVTLNADGSFQYTPAAGFSGADGFTYTLTNFAGSSSAAVTITVFAAAAAVNDAYSAARDATRSVSAAAGVLANDTVNAATITSFGITGSEQTTLGTATPTAQAGTITLNADGSFSYAPATGFLGTDTFRYTLTNFAGASTATVTFSVIVTPQANADAYSAALGTARVVDAAAGVLTNDSLNSAVLVSYGAPLGTEQATLGTATTTSQGGQVAVQADGSFTYTPAAGFTGADTFRYVVGNFSGSSTATVTFNVVAAPTASADSFEAAVNTLRTVSAAGVLANDTVNSAIISSFTATSVRGGVVAVSADGSFTYTPATDVTGVDTFTYTLTNIAGSSTNTVTMTIFRAPVAAADVYEAARNTVRSVPAPMGVLANDTLNGATLVSFTALSAQGGTIVVSQNGAFTYTPPAGYAGPDSFSYVVGNFAGNATGNVSITVRAAPAAVADAYDAARDTTRTVAAAAGVLANDTINAATITTFSATSAQNGVVAVAADGSFTYTPAAGFSGTDTFTYTLGNFAGSSPATVTLTVFAAPTAVNDTASAARGVTRTVTAPGVFLNDTLRGATLTSYGITGNEQSTPDTTTATSQGGTVRLRADGSYTYNGAVGFTGADTFRYVVTNFAGSATATVTINVVTVPVVVADTLEAARNTTLNTPAPGLLGNDTINSATLTSFGINGTEQVNAGSATPTSAGGSVTLNADGSLVYAPLNGFSGSDTFRYTLGNFAGNAVGLVTITVFTAPTANPDPSFQAALGSARVIAAPGVLVNDLINGATLISYGITGTEQTTLGTATATTGGGTVQMGADGSFTFTSGAATGADTFRYRLQNFAGTSTGLVTITVFAPPVTTADGVYDTLVGTALMVAAPGVLANDTVNASTLSSYGINGNEQTTIGAATTTFAGGSVQLSANGSFTYAPPAAYAGLDRFNYRLTNFAGSSTATVNLRVVQPAVAVADLPAAASAVGTAFHTGLNQMLTSGGTTPSLLANDSLGFPLATVVSFGPVAAPMTSAPGSAGMTTGGGSVTVNLNGSFSYTPPGPTFTGTDQFAYVISNGTGMPSAAVVTIAVGVRPGGAAAVGPVAVNANIRIDTSIGTATTLPFVGDVATLATVTAPTQGTVTINNTTRTFIYTPNAGATGMDSFTYSVSNGFGTAPTTGTVTLQISTLRVWFVDNSVAGPGSGRLHDPWSVLPGAAATVANDWIHLRSGTYTSGIVMKTGQRLIGSPRLLTAEAGFTTVPHSIPLPAVGAAPIIMPPSGSAVTLVGINRVVGVNLTVGNSTVGVDGNSAGMGTTSVEDVVITATGTGRGIQADAGTANTIVLQNVDIASQTGAALTVTGSGTLSVDPVAAPAGTTLVSTAGIALSASAVTLAGNVVTLSSAGGANGITLVNTGGSLTAAGGALSGHTGADISISGGAGSLSYDGTISHTVNSTALSVVNKTGGTVTLSGALTLNTGASNAVSLTNNTGASIALTGGNLLITTSATGLLATGGGTLTVTGAANTINAGVMTNSGPALVVENTSIGGGGLTFRTLTARGAQNGIRLINTGAGFLTVAGTGTNGSGGIIANATRHGVWVERTGSVTLNRMDVDNSAGSGVLGDRSSVLELRDCRFTSNNSDNVNLDPLAPEHGAVARNLTSTFRIVGGSFQGAAGDNVRVEQASGTLTLAISTATVGPNSAATGANGIAIITTGTPTINGDILSNTITGNQTAGVVTTLTDAAFNLRINSNTVTNNNVGIDLGMGHTGVGTFEINTNTLTGQRNHAINVINDLTAPVTASARGFVSGNTVGNGTANTGSVNGYGIAVDVRGGHDLVVQVANNNIRNTELDGIFVQSRLDVVGDPTLLDLHLRSNTVGAPENNTAMPPIAAGVFGIRVESRDFSNLCLDVAANTSAGQGGATAMQTRVRNTSTFRVERYAGVSTSTADMQAFLVANNTFAAATATLDAGRSYTAVANGACRDP